MQNKALKLVLLLAFLSSMLLLSGCSNARGDETKEAPPAAKITLAAEASLFTVDHPEQFPLAAAEARAATSELVVTGTVAPDVSRAVPVHRYDDFSYRGGCCPVR